MASRFSFDPLHTCEQGDFGRGFRQLRTSTLVLLALPCRAAHDSPWCMTSERAWTMTASKTDVTAFFERSASRLNISPVRLAVLVNDFETLPLNAWDRISDIDDVEMADIEELRDQLLEYLAKAKDH